MKALNPAPQPEMRTAVFPLEGGSVTVCAPAYMTPDDAELLSQYLGVWLRFEINRPQPEPTTDNPAER